MQFENQLCQRQGHGESKLRFICIFGGCKEIYRYLCDICLKENNHKHNYGYNFIECENFLELFQDLRINCIEQRLNSQKGNHAKLKYLKRIDDDDFNDLVWIEENVVQQKQILEKIEHQKQYNGKVQLNKIKTLKKIRDIIRNLINGYQNEMEQVKLFNEIFQQLMKDGLFSLNDKELNILLDEQFKFVNEEIEYYNDMNLQLNQLDQYEEDGQSENQQKLRLIQKKLRRINDYLDIQQYSVEGKQFSIDDYDRSFFQKKNRYFAIYDVHFQHQYLNQLKIRKQNNFNVSQYLNIKNSIRNISFDPLFNYCIIQSQCKLDALLYTLKICKQFKLIRKLLIEEKVREFYVSKNNIILVLLDSKFIKVLNIKNELITEIDLECSKDPCLLSIEQLSMLRKALVCYGSQRNIIAFEDFKVKVYLESYQQALFSINIGKKLKSMKFTNDDSQLLTLDLQYCRVWQIDYSNFKITQINKIRSYQYQVDINELNFTQLDDGGIQIQDKNLNLWYRFKLPGIMCILACDMTKNLIIVRIEDEIYLKTYKFKHISSKLIKRRSVADYGGLENDY